jgi:hypothetical protein
MPARLMALATVSATLGYMASVPTAQYAEGANCQVIATTTGAVKAGVYGSGSHISAQVTVDRVCSNPDAPAPVSGGGGGGAAVCHTSPRGSLAQVQRVWAAVNAARAPHPKRPRFTDDEIRSPASLGRSVERSWFRIHGDSIEVLYLVSCPGQPLTEHWVTVTPDGRGSLVPQVRAIDLVPALHAEVVRRLPTPLPRIGPADENPDGWTYVQHRTFFWIDQQPGQWEAVSGSTSAGGITVTVQAVPERLVVNPGDGSPVLVCEGPQPAVTAAAYRTDVEGCAHRYRHSSATAPNGATFPVVASIVWHASWTASTGEGGDLGYISTTSDVRQLPVAEIQAVLTDG